MKSVCVWGSLGVVQIWNVLALWKTRQSRTLRRKRKTGRIFHETPAMMGGDESVLLGDDFQTFNQHSCLLNTTFATVRAVPRAPSVRMYVFETKVYFTSWERSHIIWFFVSKTHENLKHSETTKMTRQKQPTEPSSYQHPIFQDLFWKLWPQLMGASMHETELSQIVFHFCCNYQKWLPAMH